MEWPFVFFLALLLGSAFFSSTETAFTSLSPVQVLRLSSSKNPLARLASHLHAKLDLLITTVLIGNNLVNIGASVLSTLIVLEHFGDQFIAVGTVVVTLIVILFGEVFPKQVAINRNEALVVFAALPIALLMRLFLPLSWIISRLVGILVWVTGGARKREISLEGILMMVKAAEQRGVLQIGQDKIVHNVFRTQDLSVKAAMTHRTSVFCLNQNLRAKDALDPAMNEGYSRIPLFKDHPESITGILLLRNLVEAVLAGKGATPLHRMMKDALFVPESRKVSMVMLDFQKTNQNIAVVLDEYGGLAGIVTREDLLEEVFGEIYDEDETVKEQMIQPQPDGTLVILGMTPLHHVEEFCKVELKTERVATFGGYIAQLVGRVPTVGDRVESPLGTVAVRELTRHRVFSAVLIPPGTVANMTL